MSLISLKNLRGDDSLKFRVKSEEVRVGRAASPFAAAGVESLEFGKRSFSFFNLQSSFSFLLAVVATAATLTVNAADTITWIDDPANRGTEAEPINLYDATKWESGELPSDNYNINFTAEGRTYVTNGTPDSTKKIARSLRFVRGDFVVFGPMRSASYGAAFPETGSVSVDKRGDWVVESSVYAATGAGVHLAFTNRTGNLEICNGGPARIGCANNSEVSFVLEGGR